MSCFASGSELLLFDKVLDAIVFGLRLGLGMSDLGRLCLQVLMCRYFYLRLLKWLMALRQKSLSLLFTQLEWSSFMYLFIIVFGDVCVHWLSGCFSCRLNCLVCSSLIINCVQAIMHKAHQCFVSSCNFSVNSDSIFKGCVLLHEVWLFHARSSLKLYLFLRLRNLRVRDSLHDLAWKILKDGLSGPRSRDLDDFFCMWINLWLKLSQVYFY